MPRKIAIALVVIGISIAASSQTKWYRFSKGFIKSHYGTGSAIGALEANASAPAKAVHRIECGGNDGELHIGVEASSILQEGDGSDSISGPADGSEEFGVVAEPPNVSPAANTQIQNISGKPVRFAGYFRVWNEGHDAGPVYPSNPHHVLEVHPVWGLRSGNVNLPTRGSRVFPMKGYAGYGASKFKPLLTGLPHTRWLKVAEDGDYVYVQLLKADNFYQLPIIPRQINQIPGGIAVLADVFSDQAHQNLVYRNLTIVTARGSRASRQLQVNSPSFMLGFFSVNLSSAMRIAEGHEGQANAVFAPAALEFFAFGFPREHAVRSSACDPDAEPDD